jgi:tRNA 5-methylaminomethyl-2-thiouridine biosynthesis bifunctional protein
VAAIRFENGQWCVQDTNGKTIARADFCVIAAGPALEAFVRFAQPLEGRLGQISLAPIVGSLPTNALAGGPYAAPFQDQLIFGATYAAWDLNEQSLPSPSVSADHFNKAQLARIAPELSERIELSQAYGRVSVRTVSPDKIPIAGAATLTDASTPTGLYVIGALGSRGFTTAHVLAEYVAALACGEFAPMEREVVRAIAPQRFVARALKKATIMRSKVDKPTR